MKSLCICVPIKQQDLIEIGIKNCEPAFGSIQGYCSICGVEVWIGPRISALRALLKNSIKIICVKCGVLFIRETKEKPEIKSLGGGGACIKLDNGEEFKSYENN